MEEDEIEVIEHEGEHYFMIDHKTINLQEMEEVQKVADVFACKVKQGKSIKVRREDSEGNEEGIVAYAGEWIVYNIDKSCKEPVSTQIETADVKVITSDAFEKLYELQEKKWEEDDLSDGSDFSDYGGIASGIYKYIGKAIYAAKVDFNFALMSPWGELQLIRKGGFVVYNTTKDRDGERDIYGVEGPKRGKGGGYFTKSYSIANDGDDRSMDKVYNHVIKANLSPLPGLQFNTNDLKEAYARLGKVYRGHMFSAPRGV